MPAQSTARMEAPTPAAATLPVSGTPSTHLAISWQESTPGMAAAAARSPAENVPLPMNTPGGTDPSTPATTAMPMPSRLTAPGLPSHYSVATPPHSQSVACGGVSSTTPLIDPLHASDPWGDHLSGRMSTGYVPSAPSAPSVGTQGAPGFSHVRLDMQGQSFSSYVTPSIGRELVVVLFRGAQYLGSAVGKHLAGCGPSGQGPTRPVACAYSSAKGTQIWCPCRNTRGPLPEEPPVGTHPTDRRTPLKVDTLWIYIELLESELNERTLEENERNRRKPQPHAHKALDWTVRTPRANPRVKGRTGGKPSPPTLPA
eukprot:5297006-Amphidinium_carterae.1